MCARVTRKSLWAAGKDEGHGDNVPEKGGSKHAKEWIKTVITVAEHTNLISLVTLII